MKRIELIAKEVIHQLKTNKELLEKVHGFDYEREGTSAFLDSEWFPQEEKNFAVLVNATYKSITLIRYVPISYEGPLEKMKLEWIE